MDMEILLQLIGAILLTLIAAIGFTKKFAELWHQATKFPKILLDLLLGFCLLLPQIFFLIALNSKFVDTSVSLLVTFENIPFLFLLIPGILAFFQPLTFTKSAALYEVPLLFALCLVYLLFSLLKGQNFAIGNYSFLLIFPLFCFDMFRMKELGNYDSPTDNNFSEKKALGVIMAWALVFSVGLAATQIISINLTSQIYDLLVLNVLAFLILDLPYLCILIIMLTKKIPWDSFLRANILRCVMFCSLLLPIDMLLRQGAYSHWDSGILTLDTLIFGFLWYCITCLKKIDRLIGMGMLLTYFIYIYYMLR